MKDSNIFGDGKEITVGLVVLMGLVAVSTVWLSFNYTGTDQNTAAVSNATVNSAPPNYVVDFYQKQDDVNSQSTYKPCAPGQTCSYPTQRTSSQTYRRYRYWGNDHAGDWKVDTTQTASGDSSNRYNYSNVSHWDFVSNSGTLTTTDSDGTKKTQPLYGPPSLDMRLAQGTYQTSDGSGGKTTATYTTSFALMVLDPTGKFGNSGATADFAVSAAYFDFSKSPQPVSTAIPCSAIRVSGASSNVSAAYHDGGCYKRANLSVNYANDIVVSVDGAGSKYFEYTIYPKIVNVPWSPKGVTATAH